MASKAFCTLSTCFLLESHAAASALKRALFTSWEVRGFESVVVMLEGCVCVEASTASAAGL
jgi:hypothetical protein